VSASGDAGGGRKNPGRIEAPANNSYAWLFAPPRPHHQSVKRLTRRQIQARREKAARFTETVLDDPERAQEIRDESLESYAERRKFKIENASRRATMAQTASPTKAELTGTLDELTELLEEALDPELTREELVDKVKEAADLASGEAEEPEEEDEDEGEED